MLSFTLASCMSLVLATLSTASTVGQIVQTTGGPVQGHAASHANEVSEYLGIPYAEPPIGELRFQPPTPFNGTQIIDAASFGASCMAKNLFSAANIKSDLVQTLGMTDAAIRLLQEMEPQNSMSEDCLTLNIWTKPQTSESKKAVLVWIHGGGFISGGSAVPWYNGQFIADQEDVVVVTMNYRLNIFGFPGSPTSQPNLGLLDQRLAVEWIRSNIAGFGGDPNRITLFGESAGGISVDYYSYAWVADPIVHGFISQSGTATSLVPPTTAEASANWFNASAALGCGNASSDPSQVFECIRRKPAADILSVVPNLDLGSNLTKIAFSPTVDEVLVFSNYRDREAAELPMVVGNDDFEAGLFRLFSPTVGDDQWHIFNQRTFVCPVNMRAHYGMTQGIPIYRYRYFGEFPNLRLTTNPPSGAWHASEIPVLFGTTSTNIANTPEQDAIGKYMRGAWAAFAKDPANGLTRYEYCWPKYSPDEQTLVRIGFNKMTGTNLAVGNQYDAECND